MTGELIPINFKEDVLGIVEDSGNYFVAMKPICEALGLDWEAQRQLINRDPILESTACIRQATGRDGKEREMVCLPLHYLNGWLFKLDANRYEGERQAKIIRYQLECYQILHDHFFGVDRKQMAEFRKQLNELATQSAEIWAVAGKAVAKVEAWERKAEQEVLLKDFNRAMSRAGIKMYWIKLLIRYRTKHNLTQAEAGRLLNVSRDKAQYWENRIKKVGLWPEEHLEPKIGPRPGLQTRQLTLMGVS